MNDEGTVSIKAILDPRIVEAISPTYPRWEKKCIKREYGQHPAVYLDVWRPFPPSLLDLLPRVKMDKTKMRWRKRQ